MKVSRIYIKDYNQFKDFELDLTYPEGHEKAGQPLDKVCFIGQSGTGKTSLLNKLNWSNNGVHIVYESIVSKEDHSATNGRDYKNFEGQNHIKLQSSDPEKSYKVYDNGSSVYIVFKNSQQRNLHYPKRFLIDATFGNKDLEKKSEYWDKIVEDIVSFREKDIQKKLQIAELLTSNLGEVDKVKEEVEKYEKWVSEIMNPIKDLGENFLDKILNSFNLRVRQKLDFLKTEDISSIKIETLQGLEIPNALLSTGTRQILLTTLPLYALKPEKALVLIDEPETSLYPDVQYKIVDFYNSLCSDCQFFFATHSPLIASSFEPWEIVELKFKEDGSVYRELYYKGENHVDNYTINPQLLRWDGILQRVFDLDKASNPKRNEALSQLARLKKTLERNTLSPEERAIKWKEYSDLAEKLNWDIEELDTPKTDAKN